MALLAAIATILVLLPTPSDSVPTLPELNTIGDLADQYYNIFKSGNRNAASHLWTSAVMSQSARMSEEKFTHIMKGYCAVSGSPIPDRPDVMYKVTLPSVTGGTVTGVSRHCCWPCICDMSELVRIDTKTVTTADGPKSYHFLVIGDPCSKPEQLEVNFVDPFSNQSLPLLEAAPEVVCEGGKLTGAIFSDHGHPIIGMFFVGEAEQPVEMPHTEGDPTYGYGEMCVARKKAGYNSGMGLIFHLVARISPIAVDDAPQLPKVTPEIASALGIESKVQLLKEGKEIGKPCVHGKVPAKPQVLSASLGLGLLAAVATPLGALALRRRWQRKATAARDDIISLE